MKSAKPKTDTISQAIQVKVEGQQRFFQAERAGNIFEGGSPGFFSSTSGNAVQSKPFFTKPFIQTKLTIGQPGDKYEREADAMPDQVVQKQAADGPLSIVQSMCSECAQEEDGNGPKSLDHRRFSRR
ncbi:hypothetical protein [Lunatibacter salilacus]|uniref:hypothetical protein n=1 Tax=Lunatibacter salilacus TaxID=2483804 RepID=UPI0018FE9AB9|nr:hypothetical protein [Lunatibacter salilacus]